MTSYYGKTYYIGIIIIIWCAQLLQDIGISWLEICRQKALFDYYDNTYVYVHYHYGVSG